MTLFYLAVIDISEYITYKLSNNSLKKEFYKNRDAKRKILLGGLVGGIILDGTLQWLGKFWIYPFWSTFFYISIFVIGFAFYFLTILESYIVVKTVLDYFRKGKKYITKPYKYEKNLFRFFVIVGIVLLFLGISMLIYNYSKVGGYVFNIREQIHLDSTLSTVGVFLTFFGIWLILEYLLHKKSENSMISTALHGYYIPLLATFISAYVLLAFMESLNGPLLLWDYVNVPWGHIKVFSMPVLGVVGWPFQNIGVVSLYALIFHKDENILIAGDMIE